MEKLTIFQIKWYCEKEKTYKEEFCRTLQTAMEKASTAFDEGSKYFGINLIEIK